MHFALYEKHLELGNHEGCTKINGTCNHRLTACSEDVELYQFHKLHKKFAHLGEVLLLVFENSTIYSSRMIY